MIYFKNSLCRNLIFIADMLFYNSLLSFNSFCISLNCICRSGICNWVVSLFVSDLFYAGFTLEAKLVKAFDSSELQNLKLHFRKLILLLKAYLL